MLRTHKYLCATVHNLGATTKWRPGFVHPFIKFEILTAMKIDIGVFWFVTPCLASVSDEASTLKMEAAHSSTLVPTYQTLWCECMWWPDSRRGILSWIQRQCFVLKLTYLPDCSVSQHRRSMNVHCVNVIWYAYVMWRAVECWTALERRARILQSEIIA